MPAPSETMPTAGDGGAAGTPAPATSEATGRYGQPAGWFRRVTLYGVLGGLCPLIPVPFLDDRCLDWVQRRMATELLARRGLRFAPTQAAYLVGVGEGRGLGCFRMLVAGVFYVIKKIFRKVVFIFTLKDCTDRFSETFHQGYLLERCLAREAVTQAAFDQGEPLRPARQAILRTVTEVDPRPVNRLAKRAFRGSRRLLVRAAGRLGLWVRNHPQDRAEPSPTAAPGAQDEAETSSAEPVIEAEETLLGAMVDRLSVALLGETDYLEALDRLLAGHLRGESS